MNRVFSFSRFGRYFKYDFRRWMTSYGLTFILTAAMPVILYLAGGLISLVWGEGWNTPGISIRVVFACLVACVFVLTYPSNVYGFVTDRKVGAMFTVLPVSVTEKFVSMLLNSIVVLPALFVLLYFSCDALICLIDPSCGGTLFASATDLLSVIVNAPWAKDAPVHISLFAVYMEFAAGVLYFLLGAVCFKKHKILYPVLILIGVQMLLSVVAVPFFTAWLPGLDDCAKNAGMKIISDPDSLGAAITAFNVITTLGQLLLLALLGGGIYWRLRTVKH